MPGDVIRIMCIAAGVFLLILCVWVFFRKGKPKKKKTPYVEALSALVSGDRSTALEKFRETVRIESHNVDAYLQLGNLLREEGDIERALKVHKSLTVRSLSPTLRMEVFKALASDYVAVKKYDQARECIEKILELDKKDEWALKTLLSIHEERGEWDNGFETLKHIQRLRGVRDDELLALYKVFAGKMVDDRGEHHRARLKYKEALRIDERCTSAYLYLGDSYLCENRIDDAITYWKKIIDIIPEHAYLAFERLEKAHFDIGDFGEMARIYERLLERKPDDLRSLFALVTIKEKMGMIDEAITMCHHALEKEPQSVEAKWCLVKCYHEKGDDVQALEYALHVEKDLKKDPPFRCSSCGYESKDALWRCPECKTWRTFL